jgi:hypothetical protein
MKRQVTNLPWLKWFSKNLYSKEIPMLRPGNITILKKLILSLLLASFTACATSGISTDFHDPEMDFGALRTVAVMPFENLARDKLAGERVRDTFANSLLATGAVYVIPTGEVARGVARAGLLNPAAPSLEEIVKLAGIIKVDAVITGVVREYGEVRSGAASANIISVSLQMIEIQTRKVVWTASSSKGGISIWDRLFGSGGEPMNAITGAAVNELLDKLFN